MKIYWGINSKLEKDFQNSETLFCKLFTAWGGMCGPIQYLSDRRVAEPQEQARFHQASSEGARSRWIGDQYESGCGDQVKSNN